MSATARLASVVARLVSRRASTPASLLILLALVLGGAPAWGQETWAQETGGQEPGGQEPVLREARALLARFRAGDVAERRRALERLSALGDAARPALEAALPGSDPDLRFHILFLLSEPFGRLDEALRSIVLGKPQNAATYPEALAAYQEILAEASPETPRLLVHLLRRGEVALEDARVAAVILDVLRALTEAAVARDALTAEDVTALLPLFALDLRGAFHELVPLFAAIPWRLGYPALRSLLRSGEPLERARAARVLAEVAPEEPALAQALPTLLPLLQDPQPLVRRAALQALDLLPIATDQPLTPVVSLVLDADQGVAAEALRVVGERGLLLAREGCEQVVSDRLRSPRLRRAAARALGLMGDPAAAAALLPLVESPATERRLLVTAAWALGAVGAPNARAVLERLIAQDELSREEVLYHGLARLGATGREALLELARPRPPFPRTAAAVSALRARAELAIAALAAAPGGEALDALGAIASARPVSGERQPGVTPREVLQAILALGDRREPAAAHWLGRILLEHHRGGLLPEETLHHLLERLSECGLPAADAELRGAVATALVGRIRLERDRIDLSNEAKALALIDPQVARHALREELARRRRDPQTARTLAWSLARAGDIALVEVYGLPFSRRELDAAAPGDRDAALNNYGIDLLFARRYRDALVEFRRMLWCDPSDETATYNIACGYALLGDARRAMHYLRRSVASGFTKTRHIETDGDLSILVGRPEFERLVRRLRLAVETNAQLPDMGPPGGR